MNHRLKSLATVALVFATGHALAQSSAWLPNSGRAAVTVPLPASSTGGQRLATVAINVVKAVNTAIKSGDIPVPSSGIGNRIGHFANNGYVRAKFCALEGMTTWGDALYSGVNMVGGADGAGAFLWQLNSVHNGSQDSGRVSMNCFFNGVAGNFAGNAFPNGDNIENTTAWVEGPTANTWVPDQPAGYDVNGFWSAAVPSHYVATRTMYQHTDSRQLNDISGQYVTLAASDSALQAYDICIINPADPSCAPVFNGW